MRKKSKVHQADEKMGQLTIDIGEEGRVPVELGSPANKRYEKLECQAHQVSHHK